MTPFGKHSLFFALLKRLGLPIPVTEYRFDRADTIATKARQWRFDYAYVEQRVALEVEGGVWTGGRHTRGAGFLKDMAKYNRAAILGWRVLRTTPDMLTDLATSRMIASALGITLPSIGAL